MQDNEIIEKVLIHLQGYIVESEQEEAEILTEDSDAQEESNEEISEVIQDLANTTNTDTIITDLQYDKKVSSTEVINFFNLTKSYALSYMNRRNIPTIDVVIDGVESKRCDPVVCDALYMWTAGKIWQKYNVRVNNNEDETNTLGYGDKLVIQAKEILKPYKYYRMVVY